MLRWTWALLFVLFATPALAQGEPLRGPAPAWIVDPVVLEERVGGPSSAAPLRIRFLDQQVRFDTEGTHGYQRYVYVVGTSQGLAAAVPTVMWNPASQVLTIHEAVILRGSERIDLLSGQDFEILRREANFESAILDGVLTAILQPRGLRVGDTLDFSYTITTQDPVMGPHFEYLTGAAFPLPVERTRIRASWPVASGVRVRVSEPLTLPAPRRVGDRYEIELDLHDLQPLQFPDNVPPRFLHARQIELTDFNSWGDIARLMAPLYEQAAVIEPGSPLMAEVEAIRAAGGPPEVQAAAALRLVQDEIRYVALAMGEGGLVPVSAEETWRNRFGDCKAKTALLIAILRELGIEAHPALVSSVFGDGLDERLPLVLLLDHVIVRVVIDGRVYWLDGTRTGDRSLVAASAHPFVWALPVRAEGGDLERIPRPPLETPNHEAIVTLDLSDGLDAPGASHGEIILRGAGAFELNAAFAALLPADRDALLLGLVSMLVGPMENAETTVTLDEEHAELRIGFHGTNLATWSSTLGGPRRFDIPGGRPSLWINAERRPGPHETLPLAISHPEFFRQTTTVILPYRGAGFALEGEDMNLELAGYQLVRTATLENGVVTLSMVVRSLVPELPIATALADRDVLRPLLRDGARVRAPNGYLPTTADLEALNRGAPTTASGFVERGLRIQSGGDYGGAIAEYDRAIALDSDYANAYANRGIARFHLGDFDGAAEDFERASDLDPAEAVAMNGRGLLAMRDGLYRDAVIEFSRSIRQSRNNGWALAQRANAYWRLGELDKALADVEAVLRIMPGDPGMIFFKAHLLVKLERGDEAVAVFTEAAEHDADNGGFLYGLAELQLEQGDAEAALVSADRLVETAPSSPDYLMLRGKIRHRASDTVGALVDFDRARTVIHGLGSGEDPDADQVLLLVVIDGEEQEGAQGLNTYRANLLNNLCWTLALENLVLDQALADCDAALALSPESAHIMDSRAMVLLRLGRHEDALAQYDQALERSPRLPPALYGRGLAKQALGREAQGLADMEAALAIHADVVRSFETYVAPAMPAPVAEP